LNSGVSPTSATRGEHRAYRAQGDACGGSPLYELAAGHLPFQKSVYQGLFVSQ
jgi:hypothetical protein